MNFVLHKDKTVPTASGHTIAFTKNVPTYVPPECYNAVIAIGAIPEDEIEEPEALKTTEPEDPAARKAAVFKVFDDVVTRNRREDFGAGGSPNGKVVNDELGWPLSAKDRATLWSDYKAEKGSAE